MKSFFEAALDAVLTAFILALAACAFVAAFAEDVFAAGVQGEPSKVPDKWTLERLDWTERDPWSSS